MTKTIKKSLALILSILMLMSVVPMNISFAADVYVCGEYEYILSGEDATIIKYNGTDAVVEIPDNLDGHTVKRIGADELSRLMPFYENPKLTKVTIPDSVECIGYGAFYKCPLLETVILGDNVEVIEAGAFRNSPKLSTVTINEKLTSIAINVFGGCSSLNTVNYKGTRAQWEILIENTGSNNNAILETVNTNLTINYNYGHECTDVTYTSAVEAGCTTGGRNEYWTCNGCGKIYSDINLTVEVTDVNTLDVPASHEMKFVEDVRATCTSEGKKEHYLCTACSKIFGDINGKIELDEREITTVKPHDGYSEKAKAPTCTEDGNITYVGCYTCGKLFTDKDFKTEIKIENTVIPALTHDWSSNYIDGKDGKHYKPCRRNGCNAVNEDSAEAHVWNSGEIIKDSTCTELGTMKYICTIANCNATRTEEIEKKPHTEVYYKQPATCTEDGKEGEKWCTVCEKFTADSKKLPALGHDWEKLEGHKDATCTEEGKNNLRCKRDGCDATDTSVTEPLGHEYPENWDVITKATCLLPGVQIKDCTRCGVKTDDVRLKETIPALGHTFKDEDKISANNATCISGGNDAYKKCDTCNLYFAADAEKNSADGTDDVTDFDTDRDSDNHADLINREGQDSTCTDVGFVGGTYCTACATWVSENGGDEIEALGHTFNAVDAVDATCLGAGNYAYKQCSTCELYFDNEAEDDALDGAETNAEFIIPQEEHSYIGVVRSNGNGEENTHSFKCVNGCDAYGATEPHDWNNGAITTPARCLTDGVMTYTCEEEDCGATYTTVIPATKHSFSAEVDYKATSCLEAGNEAYKYCAGCELYFAEDAEITSTEGVEDEDEFEIEILTHSYIGAVRSNGNGENNTHSFKCVNGCNQYGGADNHAWNNGAVTTAPNCLDRGVKTYTCTVENCGATYTESIQAIGHDFDTTVEAVAATCVAKGNNAYKKCKVCNKYFAGDAAANATGGKNSTTTFVTDINTNNHDWSEEVFTTSDGTTKTHTRKCTRTGCVKTQTIGHNVDDDDFVQETAATCINTGTEKAYCSYCRGDVYRIIPATGICVDKDKNNKCDVCEKVIEEKAADPTPETPDTGDKEEPINCDCNCHKSGIMGLLYDFILFFQRLFGLNKTCVCGRAHY